MSEVHVPFVKGLHEETEKRLLPQGYMTRAENVRFEKEGRVISRNGYVFIEGAEEENDEAAVNYEDKRTLHFKKQGGFPTQWYQRKPDGTFTTPAYASCMSSMEAPKRTVATPTIRYSALASDMAIADPYLFVVYNDADSLDDTRGGLFYSVYERQTMQIVASGVIVEYGEATSAYFNPRCIALGTLISVFYMKDDDLLCWQINMTTLVGADKTLSPAISIAVPVTGHHTSFDVCPFDADEVAVVVEDVVTGVSVGSISFYRINVNSGAVSLAFSATGFGAEPKQVGVAQSGTQYGIACITDGDVKFGSYTSTGTVLTAVADKDASGDALGAPCIGTGGGGYMLAWGRQGSPAGQMGAWTNSGWGSPGNALYVQALWPVCKPFQASTGQTVVWAVDQTHVLADDPDGLAGGFGTYRLVDIGNLFLADPNTGSAVSEVVCAQEAALAGNWYYGEQYEQRRHSVVVGELDINGRDVTTHITALPTLVGAARTAGRVDFVEFRSGVYVDKLYPAKLNGQLFLSGPRVREFDGSQLYESGLYQGPNEFTVEQVSGGTEFLGIFQFCVLWKWIDAGGRIHRSQVSPIREAEGVGENQGFEITVAPPPFSDRTANGTTTIFVEVYRTLANESVFHLLNPNERYVYTPDLATALVISDEHPDIDIEDNEIVYTQIGNTLDNQEPPPCKYVWAGEDRLLMGGLEDPSMYQFSKKSRPGLAVAFQSDEAFRGTIEGDVTGVAQLDGSWFIGSRESIWAVVGQGPDDSGAGEFSPPRKLPSDTGFTSFRSILEVPQGLLFQGKGNRMFLLPRGGAAPVWVGKTIQDTLTAYPFITSATYLPEESIAVFACRRFADGDDIDDDGRLIIFDTDTGEWVTDEPFQLEVGSTRVFSSLTTWGSKLLLNGNVEETSAWTDDFDGASPTWITGELITGDVRFFGANGYGRCRGAMLLGEALSDFVNVNLQVSRDSGTTWDTPTGTFAPADWTDQLEYRLPQVRGDSFRFWLQVTPCDDAGVPTPGEGAALNALSCEVYQSGGLKKLSQEKRA